MKPLLGKIALVTGGSRGIGRAICVALAQKGARVVINYATREDEAEKTAALVKEVGGETPHIKRFDVGDSTQVDEAIKAIVNELGSVDILVNNAGVSRDGLMLRCKDDDFAETLRIDLNGAFYCSRSSARFMMKKRWGRIINITSVVGDMGNAGQVAYASAKAGLMGMTKSLAKELASRSITVNAVAPGAIETDMTLALPENVRQDYLNGIPLGYLGSPNDVGFACAFLATDEARYITGHCLAVNGGMYM